MCAETRKMDARIDVKSFGGAASVSSSLYSAAAADLDWQGATAVQNRIIAHYAQGTSGNVRRKARTILLIIGVACWWVAAFEEFQYSLFLFPSPWRMTGWGIIWFAAEWGLLLPTLQISSNSSPTHTHTIDMTCYILGGSNFGSHRELPCSTLPSYTLEYFEFHHLLANLAYFFLIYYTFPYRCLLRVNDS